MRRTTIIPVYTLGIRVPVCPASTRSNRIPGAASKFVFGVQRKGGTNGRAEKSVVFGEQRSCSVFNNVFGGKKEGVTLPAMREDQNMFTLKKRIGSIGKQQKRY